MSSNANLYVDQGVDFNTNLNLFSDDGSDFDITTQTFKCDVRKIYSSKIAFSGSIEIEPEDEQGTITLSFPAETTTTIEPGKYQYDVLMIGSSGERTKILEGLLFLLPTVTTITPPNEE